MVNNRAVIDTNVLVSAIIGQHGYPRKVFDDLVLTGEVKICLSPQVLKEYEEVTQREKFNRIPGFSAKAKDLLSAIRDIALFIQPQVTLSIIRDEPDNRMLELALSAQARVIVTGNTNDFTFKEFRGVLVQTPKEFYEEMTRLT